MLRWRQKIRPLIPRTLQDYANVLNNDPTWIHLKRHQLGEFTISTLAVGDGSFVTLLADVAFLRTINPTTLTIDATFNVCPKIPANHQLLTVMGTIIDTVSLKKYPHLFKYTKKICIFILS